MKEQPRTQVMHFQNNNFKHKMKRLQISQKLVYEKYNTYMEQIYIHKIATVDLSNIYFLKNAKETCKPNNRDLNRTWIKIYTKHSF